MAYSNSNYLQNEITKKNSDGNGFIAVSCIC